MRNPQLEFMAPFKGAEQTVNLIRKYALEAQYDPTVRLFVEQIVGEISSKDYLSEIFAIYFYVLSHTRYMNDPRTIELVRRPQVVLQEIQEGKIPCLDCDDITTLLLAMYLTCGREVRIATVAFRHTFVGKERQYSHVFPQVKEPKTSRWIVTDPVAAEDTNQMMNKVVATKIWSVA